MRLFSFGKTKSECFYSQNWSASVCQRLLKSDTHLQFFCFVTHLQFSSVVTHLQFSSFVAHFVPISNFQFCDPSPIFPFTEFPTFFLHTLRSHQIWICVFYFQPLVVVCCLLAPPTSVLKNMAPLTMFAPTFLTSVLKCPAPLPPQLCFQ